MPFAIKRHDLRPRYRVNLTSTDPSTGTAVPVDLTDATSARFIMKGSSTGGAVKVDAAADFVNRAAGVIEYAWASGDTDTSGDFNVEIEVMWGTEPQTFPSIGYFTCKITDDLA